MAMQTGLSSSKVLILMGAGLTGSIILRNGRLSDVISELQELFKRVNEAEVMTNHYDASLLAAQIRHLAQEVRTLTLSRPVTIFNGEPISNGSLVSYVLPAAAMGAMGYCYMWWKGWSFSDVMFVTKRNMANAVANVSKQLEQLSAALTMTKRHLTQRLEKLDYKLDEQKESTEIIMKEVHGVKTDLSQIGFEIQEIQYLLSGLEGKMELLESKQDATNLGISYLCQIAGGIKDGLHTKFIQMDLQNIPMTVQLDEELGFSWQMLLLRPKILELPSSLEATANFGSGLPSSSFIEDKQLQGLQFLAETLKPREAEFKGINTHQRDEKSSFRKPLTVHRLYQSGISLKKDGLLAL